MSIKIHPPRYLFPTKVVESYDNDFESYKGDMIEWMRLYSRDNKTFERSNYGGYQSPDDFYLEESFAPFFKRIREQVSSTLDAYINDENCTLEKDELGVSNMWFNVNYENCYNVAHTHPGCVLAGVLWIQCPDESPIMVQCSDQFARATHEKYIGETFTPREGGMILFPSHLPHRVDINRSKTPRVSLSFNLVALLKDFFVV